MHEGNEEYSRQAVEPDNSNRELENCQILTMLTRDLRKTKLGVLAEPPHSRQLLVFYKEDKNYAP